MQLWPVAASGNPVATKFLLYQWSIGLWLPPVWAWPPGPASGLGQALRGQMVREWSVLQTCYEGATARLGLGRQYWQCGLIGLSGWPHGRNGAEWPVAGHSEVVLSLVK